MKCALKHYHIASNYNKSWYKRSNVLLLEFENKALGLCKLLVGFGKIEGFKFLIIIIDYIIGQYILT